MRPRPARLPDLEDAVLTSLVVPEPIEELQQVVAAVATGDGAGAADLLDQAKRRLQQVAVDELNRLVGDAIVEVSRASTFQAKMSTAIVCGTRLIESRPPDHLLGQFADPGEFIERCRAACAGLTRFFGAELNAALVDSGAQPLAAPEAWVRDIVDGLYRALLETQQDGLDRKAHIVGDFMGALGVEMDNVRPLHRGHAQPT